MASAKQFLGNTTMSNKNVAQAIKSGSKLKIVEIGVKETPATKDECIAIRLKGHECWIRINSTSLRKLIPKLGDDTDDWLGKDVIIEHSQQTVLGKEQTVLTVKPA